MYLLGTKTLNKTKIIDLIPNCIKTFFNTAMFLKILFKCGRTLYKK